MVMVRCGVRYEVSISRSPYGWSTGGEYERSEYKYPVVLHQHVSSFINIEDMLFEVELKTLLASSLTFL